MKLCEKVAQAEGRAAGAALWREAVAAQPAVTRAIAEAAASRSLDIGDSPRSEGAALTPAPIKDEMHS
jgi:hypothetical protein